MNKLQALVAKYLPLSTVSAANAAAFASAAGTGRGAVGSAPVDSYGAKATSASAALGLQEDTDKATLRALMASRASNLLAAGHRTAMSIVHNIGR